jgi:hypothetical protein
MYSWRVGLRRLLLGFALPDDGAQLWKEIVPLDEVTVADLELVGKLCSFCEKLFSLRKRLAQAGAAGVEPQLCRPDVVQNRRQQENGGPIIGPDIWSGAARQRPLWIVVM